MSEDNDQIKIIDAILNMAKDVAARKYGFGDDIDFELLKERIKDFRFEIEAIEG